MLKFKLSKKTKKLTLIAVLVLAALLILAYFLIPALLKVGFLLGSGLGVNLSPPSKTINLEYGESEAVDFKVSSETFLSCKAQCSYTFIDQSRREVVDEGEFVLEKNRQVVKIYKISIDKIGVGQDIYNFQVECKNIRSYLCFAPENDLSVSSSLVIVNYNLSGDLNELKNLLEEKLTSFLKELSVSDVKVQNLSRNIFELSSRGRFDSLVIEKDNLNSELDELRIAAENFHLLWSERDYVELSEDFNQSHYEKLDRIKTKAEELEEEFKAAVDEHNRIVENSNILLEDVEGSRSLVHLIGISQNSTEFILKINETIKEVNGYFSSVISNEFDSYGVLEEELDLIKYYMEFLKNKSINVSMHYYVSGKMELKRGEDYLCLLNGDCKSEAGDVYEVEDVYSETKSLLDEGGLLSSGKVKEVCSNLDSTNRTFFKLRNETLESFGGEFSDEVLSYGKMKKTNLIDFRETEYLKSFNILSGNTDIINEDIINTFGSVIKKDAVYSPIEINKELEGNATLHLLSEIELEGGAKDFFGEVCSILDDEINAEEIKYDKIPLLELSDFNTTSSVSAELSESLPMCCVFGECKPCCNTAECANDPKTFPVIFVHGHSVVRSASADYSLNTFDKLQKKLEEAGYLNAGVLLSREGGEGEWGLSGKPVSVKISYYFDVYKGEDGYATVPTKSESIDTYALRLNDLVEAVKKKTGKPKVNLIVFSMGGLVARKYIQIFGDENVDKLITIGVPNRGIVGRVSGLCPVLGEGKECIDMEENSIFMKKLNDKESQPKDVEIYNIIGKGCPVKGKDGDGVVLAEKASLKGVVEAEEYFVNGSCSGLVPQFHTELVDIDRFPEVYGYISLVLRVLKKST